LYYSTVAGITLNRKYPGHPDGPKHKWSGMYPAKDCGRHVIIASEPTTFDVAEWPSVPKNKAIIVGKNMKVTIEDVPVYAAFDEVHTDHLLDEYES
jgi:glutamine amidotransferase